MLPLVIRSEQMQALRAPFLEQFTRAAEEHARRLHANEVAAIGDDAVGGHIRAAIAEASGYGLTNKRDLLRFVSLTLMFGLRWNESPDLRWMHEMLAPSSGDTTRGDTTVPAGDATVRLHALHREVIARLARGDMPGASHA